MSALNLFDASEDDDIFSTPAKAPPKKKKQWMDDLLDDDKDLFGELKTDKDSKPVASAPSKTNEREAKTKSGGLFDDFALDEPEDKAADVNGHKDDEFVLVSHDEVPSPEEAEKMANIASTDTAATGRDSPEDKLFNQNLSYDERARIRREQRRKKAEEQKNSESPLPSSHPEQQEEEDPEREMRSSSPSPSPGIAETSQAIGPEAAVVVEQGDQKGSIMTATSSQTVETDKEPREDPSQQIRELTESLERAQSENGSLKSENEYLMKEVKSLKERIDQLEKQLADKNKEAEDEAASHKKQIVDLEEKLKAKDKEMEELKAAKKADTKHDHHRTTPITTVTLRKTPASPSASPATSRTKLRSGVDKGRPISSVADSVKKFGGGGTTSEVKKATHTTVSVTKTKPSSPAHVAKTEDKEKHSPSRKPVTTLPPKPGTSPKPPQKAIHHEKAEARHTKHHAHPPTHGHSHAHPTSHGHAHTIQKPEPPSKAVKVPHKKPHPHHAHSHHHHDKKEGEEHKKMDAAKSKQTNEATATKEEAKAESEAVAPPVEKEPPSEPKTETAVKSEETEKKAEEKKASSPTDETTIKEIEKDTTREQPSWKVAQQQQRAEKERQEKENEIKRQKQQETEEKEKEKEAEKSRSSSNASSHKEPEPVINGNVEDDADKSARTETEFTDGAKISKPKNLSASSNATKSTLHPLTNNKDDEINHRGDKIKKGVLSTNNARSSWAAPKREDCAVCGKVVYVMERLEADKVVYHKTCFKCTVCNKTLSTGTYAALQGKTYCKVHFKQLFKMKGNYDEGFGREQHKTKWIKKDQLEGESEA